MLLNKTFPSFLESVVNVYFRNSRPFSPDAAGWAGRLATDGQRNSPGTDKSALPVQTSVVTHLCLFLLSNLQRVITNNSFLFLFHFSLKK